MDFLIASVHAQEAMGAAGAEPNALASFLPLILIFVVFYFLLIRPQQKKYKQHQAMVSAIQKNDKVITSGGIHGKVKKAGEGDSFLVVEVANGVEMKIERTAIAAVPDAKLANDNKASSKDEMSKKA